MQKQNSVYIMTNYHNSVFYIGVTNNLLRRVIEHNTKENTGFTSKYNINKLVYYEVTDAIEDALNREKQLKNRKREWKIALIKKFNPEFKDMSFEIGLTENLLDSGSSPE